MFNFGDMELTSEILYKQSKEVGLNSSLSNEAKERISKYRSFVEKALNSGETYYGINTGFGYLSNVRIDDEKLDTLQFNLVRSHACGTGDYVEKEISKGLLLLRAHTFALGHTGISLECVNTIINLLEKNILPAVPAKGSVGASGDLAPLSHLALGIMGEGEVFHDGKLMDADVALKNAGVKAHKLQPKEGLSLLMVPIFMAVLSSFAVEEAKILSRAADVVGALSLDAIRGTVRAFDERIHNVRKQKGQSLVAKNFREIFKDEDGIMNSHHDCEKVQDPYSFRCIPQVHGAVRDAVEYASEKVDIELNSVTDNPLCFDDGIISGGNFHGEPMALAMDFLAIAMAEIGSMSERRVEKLTNPAMSGLPAFVIKDSGLNSGYMIPHVVTAALVSENKVLCHPASVDSIPTSADKEDHVSMGPISARKAREVISNVGDILAIELLAACQAIDILEPLKPGKFLNQVYDKVREFSPSMNQDRSLHKDIEKVSKVDYGWWYRRNY